MIASASREEREAFVRAHTRVEVVPFVPELRIHTANEVTPLWGETEAWLGRTGVDVPFWAVPWAGGQALARWVLDHPNAVRGRRVLDLGAGSGLVAIAAAVAGAARVVAVDVDPLAEVACALNALANRVALEVIRSDIVGSPLAGPDAPNVLLAGDVWYDRALAARLAPWLATLDASGTLVLTGDPGRAYVPDGWHELARYEVPTPEDLESCAVKVTRVLAPTGLGWSTLPPRAGARAFR